MISQLLSDELLDYTSKATEREPTWLSQLAEVTRDETGAQHMLVGPLLGRLLSMLVRLSGARRILEIGSFTGYSAFWMAEALPDGGTLISLEMDSRCLEIAERWKPYSSRAQAIDFRQGDAHQMIGSLDGLFDFVFIDADKTGYADYFEQILPKVREGGLICFDNMLYGGDVLAPQGDSSRALDELNRRLAADSRVENVLLSVRDGLMLARKR